MAISLRHAKSTGIPIRVHPERPGMAINRQSEKGGIPTKVRQENEREKHHPLEGEGIPINRHPDAAEVTPIRVRQGDVETRIQLRPEGGKIPIKAHLEGVKQTINLRCEGKGKTPTKVRLGNGETMTSLQCEGGGIQIKARPEDAEMTSKSRQGGEETPIKARQEEPRIKINRHREENETLTKVQPENETNHHADVTTPTKARPEITEVESAVHRLVIASRKKGKVAGPRHRPANQHLHLRHTSRNPPRR